MKQYIILNTSRKHVNYEEDKNKVPMNKPYNIQNTNISACPQVFSSGGTCTLLPSLLGVHPNCWGCKVVQHAVFCKYYAELAKTFFFCLTHGLCVCPTIFL